MTTQIFIASTQRGFPQLYTVIDGEFDRIYDAMAAAYIRSSEFSCFTLVKTVKPGNVCIESVADAGILLPADGCAIGGKIQQYTPGEPFVLIRTGEATTYQARNEIPVGIPPKAVIVSSLPVDDPLSLRIKHFEPEKRYNSSISTVFNLALIAYWNKAEERRQRRVLSEFPDEIYSRFVNLTKWKQALRESDISQRRRAAGVITAFEGLGILAHCGLIYIIHNVEQKLLLNRQFETPLCGSVYAAYDLEHAVEEDKEPPKSPILSLALAQHIMASTTPLSLNLEKYLVNFDSELDMVVFLAKSSKNCFALLFCRAVGQTRGNDRYLSYLIFDKVIGGIPELTRSYEVVDVLPMRCYEAVQPMLTRQRGYQFLDMAVNYARSVQFDTDFSRNFEQIVDEELFARELAQMLDIRSQEGPIHAVLRCVQQANIRELMALATELSDSLLMGMAYLINCTADFEATYFRVLLAEMAYLSLHRVDGQIALFVTQLSKLTAVIAAADSTNTIMAPLIAAYEFFARFGCEDADIYAVSVAKILRLRLYHVQFVSVPESHSNFLYINKYPETRIDEYFELLEKHEIIPDGPENLGQGDVITVVVRAGLSNDPLTTTITLLQQETIEAPAFDDSLQEYLEIPESVLEYQILPRKDFVSLKDVITTEQGVHYNPVVLLYTATIGGVKRIIHQVAMIFTHGCEFRAFREALANSSYYILNSQHSTFNNFLGLCCKVQIDCLFKDSIVPFEFFDFEREIAGNSLIHVLTKIELANANSIHRLVEDAMQEQVLLTESKFDKEIKEICQLEIKIREYLTSQMTGSSEAMLDFYYFQLYEKEHEFLSAYLGLKGPATKSLAAPLHDQLESNKLGSILLGQNISYEQAQAIEQAFSIRESNIALVCTEVEEVSSDLSCFDD